MGKPKVLVALRDADSAEGLVSLACKLYQGMEADITALHVVEVPAVTPLEADDESLDRPGKKILANGERAAKKFGTKLSTRLLHARQAGEAIVGEAKEQGVELLVVGHHKARARSLGEFLLGSTAQYVAHHAPCRVLIQIPPSQRRETASIQA